MLRRTSVAKCWECAARGSPTKQALPRTQQASMRQQPRVPSPARAGTSAAAPSLRRPWLLTQTGPAPRPPPPASPQRRLHVVRPRRPTRSAAARTSCSKGPSAWSGTLPTTPRTPPIPTHGPSAWWGPPRARRGPAPPPADPDIGRRGCGGSAASAVSRRNDARHCQSMLCFQASQTCLSMAPMTSPATILSRISALSSSDSRTSLPSTPSDARAGAAPSVDAPTSGPYPAAEAKARSVSRKP